MAKAARSQGSERGDHDSAPARPPGSGSTAAAAEPAVEVDVARTGGFAGITRRWTAQALEDEASDWISLTDRCPWDRARRADADDHTSGSPMPDRFVWWIRVTCSGADRREAEVPDEELTGAWRELVDAVRDWSRAVERRGRG